MLRIVSTLPVPSNLSDFEPFQVTPSGKYGMREKVDGIEVEFQRALRLCRAHFADRLTVGVNPMSRVKALFFDMDGTVIEQESIVELAGQKGCREEVDTITKAAMKGEIEFELALRKRVAQLRGLTRQQIESVSAGLTLQSGIESFAAFCQELTVPCYLVSGGFHILADPIAKRLRFTGVCANRLGFEGDLLTGSLEGSVVDSEAKRAFAQRICQENGWKLSECAAIGDGANDRPLLAAVGLAIGFQPKSVLHDVIHAQIYGSSYDFLAPLLFGREYEGRRGHYV